MDKFGLENREITEKEQREFAEVRAEKEEGSSRCREKAQIIAGITLAKRLVRIRQIGYAKKETVGTIGTTLRVKESDLIKSVFRRFSDKRQT